MGDVILEENGTKHTMITNDSAISQNAVEVCLPPGGATNVTAKVEVSYLRDMFSSIFCIYEILIHRMDPLLGANHYRAPY